MDNTLCGPGFSLDLLKSGKTILKSGNLVKVYCWNFQGHYCKEKRNHTVDLDEFTYVSPRGNKNLMGVYFGLLRFQVWLFFKLLRDDFDVVHCHNFDTLVVGYFAGRLKRKRVIFDVHDLYFTYPTLEKNSRISSLLSTSLKILEKWFARRVDNIIVTTPRFHEYYSYITQKDPVIIWNLPELSFSSVKRSVYKRNGFTVAYIGSVRYLEQLRRLLDAVANVNNIKVLIVGAGVGIDELKNQEFNKAHVTFHDEVPYSKVPEYYKISDCVFAVYDIKDDNTKYLLPVKVFEAMSFGLPVIVSKGSYAGEFVENNKVGLVVEDDLQDLTKALMLLKNDDNLYEKLRANGLRLFKEKYNWEFNSTKFLNLYG